MAFLAAAAARISTCFTRFTGPAVICSAGQSLQQQPSRGKAQFKPRSKRKHQEKLDLVYVPGRPSDHPLKTIAALESGEAGIPLLPIGETGSVFDTEIKRRTTIRDPNRLIARPFEPQRECLQWTDWRMNRDVMRRIAIAEYHPLRKNLISVRRAQQLPLELRIEAYKELAGKIPVKAFPGAATNRCAITSRPRGKFRMFRLSRIFWRHLADYNQLSGVKKAMWGP